MAKPRIPDSLARRHWLQKDMDPAQAVAIADAYLEEGRQVDAVAFLAKAGATERLEALAEDAVSAGDAFLLREVAGRLGREPAPEQWRRLAEAAEARGLERYGHTARRQADVVD